MTTTFETLDHTTSVAIATASSPASPPRSPAPRPATTTGRCSPARTTSSATWASPANDVRQALIECGGRP